MADLPTPGVGAPLASRSRPSSARMVVRGDGALAIPCNRPRDNGRTPAEVVDLVDRLIAVSYLREVPGLAVAAATW